MMAHVPLFCHSSPENVLIVGGGDGGVLREVVKHGKVSSVTMCEIDEGVVAAAKEFFGDGVGSAFGDEVLTLRHEDAAALVKKKVSEYDVIIVDSSDPTDADAPASSLYGDAFFEDCARALRPRGILCMQGESFWLHMDLIRSSMSSMSKRFGVVDYATISVPSYPCGQIGMLVGVKIDESAVPSLKDRELYLRKPRRLLDLSSAGGPLRYYSDYAHEAAFVLPRFVRNGIGKLSCDNFITSSDLPEGLPTPEQFQMLFWGMLGGGLAVGLLVGRFVLPRLF